MTEAIAVSRGPATRPAWVNRRSIAWGATDPETGIIIVHREDNRPWFAMNMRTGKDVALDYGPLEVEPELTGEEWLATLHEAADRSATISKCYFIGADDGPIKIGHSINVGDRLKAFQMGCPVKLSILATASGGEQRESAYHVQFNESRAHGEWFERTPELLAEIDRLSRKDG